MNQQRSKDENSDDLNFLINHIDLVDEEIKQWVSENPDKEKAVLEDTTLNSSHYKKITHEDLDRRQKLVHENQNQKIRIQHLHYLFILTIIWIIFIWAILILQGFKGYPFQQTSKIYNFLKFHLSDTVLIAFMTTTTTTVLGLYGIGAYWLFKGNKVNNEPNADTENSSEEPK
ncbi:hypothetical protein Q5M44_14645 [Acinetobacter pittii]|uniref:hypothetical protein n=1 Tax=Acinetobacter pittii TaxID=48296 RepID=UPI0023405589|nr:hypothetical protein [Acinetobacter pittii]MDC5024046.1 hypothetical protein [Acinetobacter baumannii]MDO7245769.1 hypothetical protein [Acinetobacter pittii]